MKKWICYLCVIAVTCVWAGKAWADPQPLFEDTFTSLDPGFGAPSATLQVSRGKLVVSTTANVILQYQVGFFTDADISATFSCTTGDLTGNNYGGIIFWATDHVNFYDAIVAADGSCKIMRVVGSRWLSPAILPISASVNKGTGTSNVARVVTVGKQATFFVNGKKMAAITGMPPAGGGLVGVYVQNDTAPCSWTVQDFKVLPPPQ